MESIGTTVQDWYAKEVVQQNILDWVENREVCWEIPQYIYTEWKERPEVVIKNWLRAPEYHSIHASPTRSSYYDYVLDIDVPQLELSKQIERAVIEVFAEFKIEPTLITFTSNRGFHNWFFQQIFYFYGLDWGYYTPTTLELFYKVATHYLRDLVAEKVQVDRKLLQKYIEVKIARSMVRVPYCFHLGTQGIEIPVQPAEIMTIRKDDTQPENIKEVMPLKSIYKEEKDESGLSWLDTVSDFYLANKAQMDELYRKPDFQKIEGLGIYAGEDIFPPCIATIPYAGNRRKCAGFITNFLYYCNWTRDSISEYMQKWYAILEQKGVTKEGHKFYWNVVKAEIIRLDKTKLFLPGCAWLQVNGLCRPDRTCEVMRRKHPRYYIMEKQKRKMDTRSANTIAMEQFYVTAVIDTPKFIFDGKLRGIELMEGRNFDKIRFIEKQK